MDNQLELQLDAETCELERLPKSQQYARADICLNCELLECLLVYRKTKEDIEL